MAVFNYGAKMANRRMISSSTWEDEFFGSLNYFQRCLWIGLFSACADDQGRMLDNVILIRAKLFPYDDIGLEEIEEGLKIFESKNKILRYKKNGKNLIQIIKWWDNQKLRWATYSKFTAPDNWTDRIRTRENNKYIIENWDVQDQSDQPDQQEQSDQDEEVRTNPSYDNNENGVLFGHVPVPVPVPIPVPDPIPVPVPVPIPVPVPDPIPDPNPIPVQKRSNTPVPVAGSLNTDQNIYRIYEANIGALTPIIANRLDMDVEDYSFEWVEKAIELAVTNEARNLVYVEAILARWKKDGFGVDKRQPKQTKRVQIDPYGNRVEL